jgi:3'(2'), 5'-bisphosphate nucleotidase
MSPLYGREQEVAIQAVRQAARLCRAVSAEISPDVLAKKDNSPVTVADFGSQALICRALAEAFPNDPVIAEEDSVDLRRPENAPILSQVVRHLRALRTQSAQGVGIDFAVDFGGEQVCRWIDHASTSPYRERFWTLDPIDGTKGFLRGEQHAIALALVVEGQVVVAALACPNLSAQPAPLRGDDNSHEPLGVIFFAARGRGAFCLPSDSPATVEPAARRVGVSLRDDLARARFCESVEPGHSAQADTAAVAARLGIAAAPLRMDSQAKYALVARGEADIYLRLPTRADYREKIWDHAAGALIVAEAGGIVTDIGGRPLEFNHGCELAVNQGVIVTNGRLHERVIGALRAQGIDLAT